MKRITHLRILVLILLAATAFASCKRKAGVLSANALSPVSGRTEEDDLKKQLETLTKKVEDQKRQLDYLISDYATFREQQRQWGYRDAAEITQLKRQAVQETRAITQQTQLNDQQTAVLKQHQNMLSQIEAQLRRR